MIITKDRVIKGVKNEDIEDGIFIIPDNITSIGAMAFSGCSSLTSITIPDSITSIEISAFSGCTSLKSITIPDSVTYIGNCAFYYCNSLTSITIPDSVTSIGVGAFQDCSSLTSVTIGNSVTSIGAGAFHNCASLISKCSNYKAFNLKGDKLMCRDYEFTENKWSDKLDDIELCKRGYHYCTNIYEIFDYYYYGELDKDIAIYECEVGDEVLESDTSKCITNRIKPIKRLYRKDIIRILNGGT